MLSRNAYFLLIPLATDPEFDNNHITAQRFAALFVQSSKLLLMLRGRASLGKYKNFMVFMINVIIKNYLTKCNMVLTSIKNSLVE